MLYSNNATIQSKRNGTTVPGTLQMLVNNDMRESSHTVTIHYPGSPPATSLANTFSSLGLTLEGSHIICLNMDDIPFIDDV